MTFWSYFICQDSPNDTKQNFRKDAFKSHLCKINFKNTSINESIWASLYKSELCCTSNTKIRSTDKLLQLFYFKYTIAKYSKGYEYPAKTAQIHGLFLNLLWCWIWTQCDFFAFFCCPVWCYVLSQLDFSNISIVCQQYLYCLSKCTWCHAFLM